MTDSTLLNRSFDEMLLTLDESALEALADYHARVAASARQQLVKLKLRREMKARVNERCKETTTQRAAIPRILTQHIVAGQNIEAAIKTVASTSGLHINLVKDEWRKWTRTKEALARNERHTLIMTLAASCRNAEIATRTGFHPNSVSRIIQKHLKPPSQSVE